MKPLAKIKFDGKELDVYGSLDAPVFLAIDVAKLIDYSNGKTHYMLELIEEDEKLKRVMPTRGQKREVWFVTELGLYNILSQSRKPIARMWRRVVHEQLILARKERGLSIIDQFEEWDDLLDTIYIDPETGILMQSITIQGGDVEQVPYIE